MDFYNLQIYTGTIPLIIINKVLPGEAFMVPSPAPSSPGWVGFLQNEGVVIRCQGWEVTLSGDRLGSLSTTPVSQMQSFSFFQRLLFSGFPWDPPSCILPSPNSL